MDSEKKKFSLRAAFFLLVGLLIFIIYLVFFVKIDEMVIIIGQADIRVYSLAFLATILDVFFFSVAWRFLMRALSVKTSVRKTCAFMWVSIFVDSVMPAESISGEISRGYLMSKEPNVETGKVVVSLVVHRVIMVLITIATLFTGTAVLVISHYPLSSFIMYLIWLVSIVTVAFLVGVGLFCAKKDWMEKLVNAILKLAVRVFRGRWHIEELRVSALEGLRSFYDGLGTLRNNLRRFISPVVFSFVSWVFSILVSCLVFAALGRQVDWNLLSIIVVVFSLSMAIKSVPVGVPAEVGVPELVMVVLYTELGAPLGITANMSAAVTILSRIVSFWFKFVISFGVTQWVGLKTIMEGMKLGQKRQTDKV